MTIILNYISRALPRFKSWWDPNRAKPKSRAPSARDLIAKPEKKRREESGEGLTEPLPRFFGISNFKSFNLVYSWKGNLEIIDFSKKTQKNISICNVTDPPC